jgi:hypothetical protein
MDMEAYSEYKKLLESFGQSVGELEQGRTSIATVRQENEQLKINSAKLEKDLTTKQTEISRLQAKVDSISQDTAKAKEEIAGLKKSEANLLKQYEDKIDVLMKCESDLPVDLFGKAEEFEIAEKLNPPMEKRTKRLPSKELVKETEKIKREAEAKNVVFPEKIQKDTKSLPLYEEEKSEETNQDDNNE